MMRAHVYLRRHRLLTGGGTSKTRIVLGYVAPRPLQPLQRYLCGRRRCMRMCGLRPLLTFWAVSAVEVRIVYL